MESMKIQIEAKELIEKTKKMMEGIDTQRKSCYSFTEEKQNDICKIIKNEGSNIIKIDNINSLNKRLLEKIKIIKNLEKEVKDKNATIDRLNSKIIKQKEDITRLNDKINVKYKK